MSYVAGLNLTFEIPLIDAAGNSVDATAVSYKVVDSNDTVLVPDTVLAGYVAGTDASVTVSAAANTLPNGELKGAREIVLTCTTPTGQALVSFVYILESVSGSLVRGVNSIVNLAGAEMIVSTLTEVTGWTSATKEQRTNALLEAYRRLSLLRLTLFDNDDDSANGAYPRVYPIYGAINTLDDLSSTEILSLDPKLLKALSQAQVVEADVILSGDPLEARRRDGLVLETIGEVKQMFRGSKPLETPVSRRALKFLGHYVLMGAKKVGRA